MLPIFDVRCVHRRDVVSISRRSFQTSQSRHGLVKMWEGLGLDLVSDWKSNVLASYHRVSFTSQYSQLFASLQNCTYIVLNAGRLYCLLIYKSKRLTVCTTENVGRQQSILQHVTLMPFLYQVCHSIGPCVKNGSCFHQVWSESQWTVLLRYLINTSLSQQMLDDIKHAVDNSKFFIVFQQDTAPVCNQQGLYHLGVCCHRNVGQ